MASSPTVEAPAEPPHATAGGEEICASRPAACLKPHPLLKTPGRRIYIRETALASLARSCPQAARAVYSVLADVVIRKACQHTVVQDGVQLGLLTASAAERVEEAVRPQASPVLADCLHRLHYWQNGSTSAWIPVLEEGEEVAGTCYFDGYYTFATTEGKANQMYRDGRPIGEVRQLKKEGRDYQDLLLLEAQRLSLDGVGREPTQRPLNRLEAAQERMKALHQVRSQVREMVRSAKLSDKECQFVCEKMDGALAMAFSRGLLKTL